MRPVPDPHLRGILTGSPKKTLFGVVTVVSNLKAREALNPYLEKITVLRLFLGRKQDGIFVMGELDPP